MEKNKEEDKFYQLLVKDLPGIDRYPLNEIRGRIILGDALEVLPKIDARSFDMVFIDPPYFLQLPKRKLIRWSGTVVNGVSDPWDRFEDFEDYDQFIRRLLIETKRVMKEKATLWIIGTYHNIHRIGKIMQDIGFWILNDIIWLKRNPVPNFLKVRFTNATETLIWAVKDKKVKGYTFHKGYAKEFGVGKVGANVWEIPVCSGRERLKNGEGKKLHPTQKPVELLRRVILTSTEEGDLILDPMAGTGTTGYVAKALNRDFVMIEREERYALSAEERIGKNANKPMEEKTKLG